MNLQWRSLEHRTLEWKIANQHLIKNGELSQDGTTLVHSTIDEPVSFRDSDTGVFSELTHSFMVLNGKILAVSNKIHFGVGNRDVMLAEDEEGHRYTAVMPFENNRRVDDLFPVNLPYSKPSAENFITALNMAESKQSGSLVKLYDVGYRSFKGPIP